MTTVTIRAFPSSVASLLVALLALTGAWLPADHGPIGRAVAAPPGPGAAERVHGVHVRRSGDMPGVRKHAAMLVKAQQAQCGSTLMKQACTTIVSDPAASPATRSRCAEMMSRFKLDGDLGSVGETRVDEYFAPSLQRSASIVKTTVLRQTGVCSAEVVPDERRVIIRHRPDGFTRHERRTDASGRVHWVRSEHRYVPGLADMLKTAFDPGRLGGKLTLTPPLGRKTLVPGRLCETRRVSAGDVAFVSCIHATGLAFPSHVTFEGEVSAGGETERVEKFVSYAYDVALPRALFMPGRGEKTRPAEDMGTDPEHPMKRWCAAEKARTGVDPCKDDDV